MTLINTDSDEDGPSVPQGFTVSMCTLLQMMHAFMLVRREKKTSSLTSSINWRKVFTNYSYMH